MTFFVKENEADTQFVRHDELHEERTYSLENYHTMLENANFQTIQIFADFSDEEPSENTTRWFFVCKK